SALPLPLVPMASAAPVERKARRSRRGGAESALAMLAERMSTAADDGNRAMTRPPFAKHPRQQTAARDSLGGGFSIPRAREFGFRGGRSPDFVRSIDSTPASARRDEGAARRRAEDEELIVGGDLRFERVDQGRGQTLRRIGAAPADRTAGAGLHAFDTALRTRRQRPGLTGLRREGAALLAAPARDEAPAHGAGGLRERGAGRAPANVLRAREAVCARRVVAEHLRHQTVDHAARHGDGSHAVRRAVSPLVALGTVGGAGAPDRLEAD